ncbi:RluA family pseudouridine synthase [Candidatus Odyssella thessalonicensis]|uniref:RluA family pseudouridine synthase n=1 Tax=Candidatus Odyssella thessalonicensis TaxID=84647 RepID=UPI000225C1DD|nr:RluA family pseudouridine synthase [Candidatus Odyssella thessalonicensis]
MQDKSDTYALTINEPQVGQRLDRVLSTAFDHLSRTRIQELISADCVKIEPHRKPSASMKVMLADVITLQVPEAVEAEPTPQHILLNIVYEDEDLLVINKQAGMVVHPAPGHPQETLVNALLAHCGNSLSGIGGVKRPGIVHRLDKDTSGLMVVAKNDNAHHVLCSQFSDRSLSRTYLAFIWGVATPLSGSVNSLIGRHPRHRQKMAVVNRKGKEALTYYHTLSIYGQPEGEALKISLVECKLATGRTHQIRVHLASLGHPLVGDPLYGRVPKGAQSLWPEEVTQFSRQALHAKEISFIHPRTKEIMHFSSDLPDDLQKLEALCKAKIR